jgi:Fe2+ transport system protein B
VETTRRTGPYVLTILLTLAQPVLWLYLLVAMYASDGCPSTATTGICDPDNQTLAVGVPFVACSAAVAAAWLLVTHANPKRQAWGVAICWVVSLAALRYSWLLAHDVPG